MVSPLDPDGVELILEPASPPARRLRDALAAEGTPFNPFAVDDANSGSEEPDPQLGRGECLLSGLKAGVSTEGI